MQLYKFASISPRSITSLVTGKFWAATLDKMNDPFEDRFDDPNSQRVVQSCGVFCASRYELNSRDVLTEPLMWAHYASNHTGIAIGLRPNPSMDSLFKVDYLSEEELRKRTNELLAKYGGRTGKTISPWAEIIFKHKLKFWQYENEYRRVYIGAANCYVNPHAKINEVVFGFKSRPEEELAVWSALRDNIKYRKANNRGGKIRIEEYEPPTHLETEDRYLLLVDHTNIDIDSIPEQKKINSAGFKFVRKNT